VPAWQRDAHLSGAASVELRRASRARPRPAGQPTVLDVEEPGGDELVEMERRQGSTDARGRGGLVAAERATRADDGVIERPPGGLVQQGNGLDVVRVRRHGPILKEVAANARLDTSPQAVYY